MFNYLIPQNLREAVIAYLEARPYKEVAPAVAALRQCPQHVEDIPKAWEVLARCIRSGQIPTDEVPSMLEQDKAFADWFQSPSAD